jgi:hypothetical protein
MAVTCDVARLVVSREEQPQVRDVHMRLRADSQLRCVAAGTVRAGTGSSKLDLFASEQPLREQVAMLGWAAEKLLG